MLSNSAAVAACIAESIPRQTILVVGDVMLDRYLWGKVERISPEAPVPVMHLENETVAAGGAANVAWNLVSLGATPLLVGLIGQDADGVTLAAMLEAYGIRAHHAVRGTRRTTVKTRIVGGHQHIARIDAEEICAASIPEEAALIAAAQRAVQEQACTAILISDYGKGVITEKFCQFLIGEAKQRGIPVLVDPKGWDYNKYRHATTLCPNRSELTQAVGGGKLDLDTLLSKGAALREKLHLQFLVATLSEQGIALVDAGTEVFPAQTREVFDVSGAGDTVIATLTAAIAAGMVPRDAVMLANIAAGVVVGKIGTVPITTQELLDEIASGEKLAHTQQHIYTRVELESLVLQWKQQGERVVFTNGCFDLLHVGHIRLLQEAKALGTKLVVAINSDASVQRLKGPERPIVKERDRAEILSHLSSVDAVTVFEEDAPLDAIQVVRPQILVKGSDYTEATVVGADLVKSWGGRVHLIPLIDGFSTTGTVKKIRHAEAAQKK